MTNAHIPVFKPNYDERELEALRPVFESGWIGMGPKVTEFEEKFAAYVNARYAVAVNSATAGLHLALDALGIGPGDEVLVPSMSFVSSAHCIEYVGAKPVFVDVEYGTLNIDVMDAEARITEKTKAIIPVHFGGQPVNLGAVHHLASQHGLAVIEDAAHACGARYDGHLIGGLSDLAVFSFNAKKNLATADGGMITTNDPLLAEKLRRLRWVGIDKSTFARTQAQYHWQYDVLDLGYKYEMHDVAAALGLVQLEKLEHSNERRRQIAAMYDVGLSDLLWIDRPARKPYTLSAQHLYVIKTSFRDALNQHLKELNIATGVHYLPIHLMTYYQQKYGRQFLAETEFVWPRILTLPVFPTMTEEEVDRVMEGIHSFPVHPQPKELAA